jgi:hypothetical protein
MQDRTLLLWSKIYEKAVSKELWDYDRVIEVPDNVTMDNYEQVAAKLAPVIYEEIAKAKGELKRLSIVPLTGQGFSSILMKVLESHLTPNGGELLSVKIAKKNADSPTVVLDDATASESIQNQGYIDFDEKPLPDNSIFSDGYSNELDPPPDWNAADYMLK